MLLSQISPVCALTVLLVGLPEPRQPSETVRAFQQFISSVQQRTQPLCQPMVKMFKKLFKACYFFLLDLQSLRLSSTGLSQWSFTARMTSLLVYSWSDTVSGETKWVKSKLSHDASSRS